MILLQTFVLYSMFFLSEHLNFFLLNKHKSRLKTINIPNKNITEKKAIDVKRKTRNNLMSFVDFN